MKIVALPNTAPRFCPKPVQAVEVCQEAWRDLAVLDTESPTRQFGPQARLHQQVLGSATVNRPYPDPALLEAGAAQDLPLQVTTPFKWLLNRPLLLGQEGDVILLPAQHEGGPAWPDGELECRDHFIALRRDARTGRFVEFSDLMTKPSEAGYVFRSVKPEGFPGAITTVPGKPDDFVVYLEEGSHSMGIYARHTYEYRVDDQGIRLVGAWPGHRRPGELEQPAPEVEGWKLAA